VNDAARQVTRNVLLKFAGAEATNDCQYIVSPTSITKTASVGNGSISLTTTTNCSWTVASNAQWLTITSPTSGAGNATINFSVTQNTGATRSGTITIADKSVVVTQNACGYSIAPVSANAPSTGANLTVNVTTDAGCTWSAAPTANWVTVSPTNGTGSGAVSVAIASNPGPIRTGGATIAGNTFAVTQSSGCTYAIAPSSGSLDSAGGSGSFNITASNSSCPWTAVPSQTWLTISANASGAGDATITYTAQPNTTPTRTATIAAGGQNFTLTQAGGCVYDVDGVHTNAPASGGNATVNVFNGGNCSWTAESHASWLTVTSGASGRGNGAVAFTIAANNTGQSRLGFITIAGRRYTVAQPAVGAPTNVVAATLGTTQNRVTWDAMSGVLQYEIARSSNGGFFLVVGATTTTTYNDSNLTPGTTYVYEVRAVNTGGTRSAFSNVDIATTILFTDDPVIARVTSVRAVHLAELRQAVNAVRAAAGLAAATWTDAAAPGVVIRDVHIEELRDELDEARDALLLPATFYSDVPVLSRLTLIRAAHINELRAGVK
jgi:hypothetical protein